MIPLAKDTRDAVGTFAERVKNRSLLFEKMVLSKSWGHPTRFDDAQRFNVLRATHEGVKILPGKEENAYIAKVAGVLAGVNVDDRNLAQSRIASTRRFHVALAQTYKDRCVSFTGALGGRLLINMAGGVMENSGMALDRITGLPIIPGTAVKGITRHTALWDIRNSHKDRTEQRQLLRQALAIFGFGDNDIKDGGDFHWAVHRHRSVLEEALTDFQAENNAYKGICAFLTASPFDTKHLGIVAEVLTPHFGNKLRSIFFPAVETGSEFAFAIVAQREPTQSDLTHQALLQQARLWLMKGLQQNGIGAKTRAGYGRFCIDPQAEEKYSQALDQIQKEIAMQQEKVEQKKQADREAAAAAKAEKERKANLSEREREKERITALTDEPFANLARELATQPVDTQLAFFDVLCNPERKETRKRWKKMKLDLWNTLVVIARQQNIDLS